MTAFAIQVNDLSEEAKVLLPPFEYQRGSHVWQYSPRLKREMPHVCFGGFFTEEQFASGEALAKAVEIIKQVHEKYTIFLCWAAL